MAKLRHIALIVPDPEESAKFFEAAFDLKRAGTARRGIYLSDGVMNVALLKQEGNGSPAPATMLIGPTPTPADDAVYPSFI